MISGNQDLELLLTLNSLVGANVLYDAILHDISFNPLFRGLPIFFTLVVLWFSADCTKRRGRMLVGLLATSLATGLSLWLQFHITPHIRPFLDPTLPLKITDPAWTLGWHRQGSFPSDTATLDFSLATVIFLENRLAGFFCFLWVLATVGCIRVALGWHYPSDILGSFVLGPGCVYVLNKIPYVRTLFERALKLFERRMYIVHALLFVFLAEAYNLFPGILGFAATLRAVPSFFSR